MSGNAARPLSPPSLPFRVVVLSGEQKGMAFELLTGGITVGRAADNDIVLTNDFKCSRHHARISLTPNGIEVVDIGRKNKIEVEGILKDSALIFPGAVFIVGSTKIRLESVDPQPRTLTAVSTPSESIKAPARKFPSPPPAPMGLPPLPQFPRGGPQAQQQPQHPHNQPPAGNRALFYGLIALVGLGAWLMFSGTRKKALEPELGGSTEALESRLEEFQKRKELLVKASEKSGPRNQQWRDAQSLYLQGFRDYKKGQYTRAIESFRGSLSIYPSHDLAARYLSLSRRRLDEMVQTNMTRAREYREKNMYQKCVAHYALAMTIINDQSHPHYKEAKVGMDECNLYLEGRY